MTPFCLSSSGQDHTSGCSSPLRILEVAVECSMQPMAKLWKEAEQPHPHLLAAVVRTTLLVRRMCGNVATSSAKFTVDLNQAADRRNPQQ